MNNTELLNNIKSVNNMDYCEDFAAIEGILDYCNDYVTKLNKLEYLGGVRRYVNEITRRLFQLIKSKSYLTAVDNQPNTLEYDMELRKITFFLILKTDETFALNLMEDQKIIHILHSHLSKPKLTKCLLLCSIQTLNLNRYFYECLKYTPIWFAYKYLDKIVEHLKFENHYVRMYCISEIIQAIYFNICRHSYSRGSHMKQISTDDFITITNRILEYIIEFLAVYFSVPNKISSSSSSSSSKTEEDNNGEMHSIEFHKHIGYIITIHLHTIEKCFNMFLERNNDQGNHPVDDGESNEKYKIYNLMEHFEVQGETNRIVSDDGIIINALKTINRCLLINLEENLKLVNSNIMLTWFELNYHIDAEIDHQNSYQNDHELDVLIKTPLQTIIGESIHKLAPLINDRTILDPTEFVILLQLFKHFSIKPRTNEEIVNCAPIGKIIHVLEKLSISHPSRENWLNEFLSREGLVFDNDECFQVLLNNCRHITVKQFKNILSYFINLKIEQSNDRNNNFYQMDYDDSDDEYEELLDNKIKLIIFKSFSENFDDAERNEILIYFSENFLLKDDQLKSNPLEKDTFEMDLIEYFNKSGSCLKMAQILILQNTIGFFEKLFETSIKTDRQQNDNLELFKLLPSAFIEMPVMRTLWKKLNTAAVITYHDKADDDDDVDVLPTTTHKEHKLLSKFIYELYCLNIIESLEFIEKYLYQLIMNAMTAKKHRIVLILLDTFKLMVLAKGVNASIGDNDQLAPLLVMISTIQNDYRWNLQNYCEDFREIVEQCIILHYALMNKFLPIATEKDKQWIKKEIKNYKNITLYYFQKLTSNEKPPMEFAEFLRHNSNTNNSPSSSISSTSSRIGNEDEKHLCIPFLFIQFGRCTEREMRWLALDQTLLKYFMETMQFTATFISRNLQENSIDCFRYILQNVLSIVKEMIIPTIQNNHMEIQTLCKDLLKIISNIKASKQISNELLTNVNQIIMEIIQSCTFKKDDIEKIQKSIEYDVNQLPECEAKLLLKQNLAELLL